MKPFFWVENWIFCIEKLLFLTFFCWWCKALGEIIAWNVLELVKIINQAYQKFVTMHGLKICSFHKRLQIEINYLQNFMEWYDAFESFENVELYANTIFFSSLGLLI
jgi:hypothetical protein